MKRDDSLDALRGFCVLLMVISHVNEKNFGVIIYSFHIPLFFTLSGYLFKNNVNQTLVHAIGRRFKRLMVPYFLFGLIHWGIVLAMNGFRLDDYAKELFLNMILFPTKDFPIAGALWFLASLFCVEVMMRILIRLIPSKLVMSIFVIVITVMGFVINRYEVFGVWGIEVSIVGIFFFFGGYLINQYQIIPCLYNNKIALIIMGILFVPVQLLCFYNSPVNMYFGWYCNEIIFVSVACYQILVLWLLFTYVIKATKVLTYAGKNTMIFIAFNQLLLLVIHRFIPFGGENNPYDLLAILLAIVALYAGVWITNKWKISRLWRS